MATPALSTKAAKKKAANTFKNPARAARRGMTGDNVPTTPGGNYIDQLLPGIPGQVNYIYDQAHQLNDRAGQIGQDAQDYTQNNPFTNQASSFNEDLLSGSMARNPWEQSAFRQSEGIRDPTNEALDALRGYLRPSNGSGGGQAGSGPSGGGYYNYSASQSANPSLWGGGSGQGGGIGDTITGSNHWVAQQIRALADPARFDPANDPTMAPYLETLRREAAKDQLSNMQDLAMQSEGSGMFGTGSHNYMMNRGREIGQESLDQLIGSQLLQSREANLARMMQGLGLAEQRDEANMNDQTQRYGIDSASASAGAGAAAAAADAAEGRRLQAMGMMLGAGSDLLGFKGNMANARMGAQNQAVSNGLGYGQLGLQGYGMNLQGQQNQLGALGLIGDVTQGISNADLQRRQIDANARVGMAGVGVQRGNLNLNRQIAANDSQMNLWNMLMGYGNIGGTTTGQTTDPGQYQYAPSPTAAALMGGLGGAASTYGTLWGN